MRGRQEGRLGERIKEGGREQRRKGEKGFGGENRWGRGKKGQEEQEGRGREGGRVNNCIQNDTINK